MSITVKSMSGVVLLGPLDTDAAETAGSLKQRLPDKGGAWRILWGERELLEQEALSQFCCAEGGGLELTAVVTNRLVDELSKVAAAAREREKALGRSIQRWLSECESTQEEQKKQQRERDVLEYERAMAGLLEQLERLAVSECRRAAEDGKLWCSFSMTCNSLQQFPLMAKFHFTFRIPVRSDPFMRGWYFSCIATCADAAEAPETIQMSAEYTRPFEKTVASLLVQRLEENHGLRVLPSPESLYGDLRLAWCSVEEEAGQAATDAILFGGHLFGPVKPEKWW